MKKLLFLLGCLLSLLSGTVHADPVRFGLREAAPLVHTLPDGRLTGLEYDIIRAAMEAAGMQLVPYLGSNARLLVAASGQAVDGFAPVAGETPERFTLTDNYITYQNVAITLTSRAIRLDSIEDLRRYRVLAFQRATEVLGAAFKAASVAAPLYREEPTQALQAAGLLYGRYDVVVAEARVLHHHIAEQLRRDGGDVTPPPPGRPLVTEHRLFAPNHYCAAFRDPALAARFNAGLRAIRQSGTYDAILARYGLTY